MNFQQLRIIRETVRRDFNFTEVANALFTSQSGVSKHVKDLEEELGVELFIRKGKRLVGLTEPGQEVERHGVVLIGPVNLPATVPFHASQMYARNVTNFLLHLLKDGRVHLDLSDELTRGPLVTHQGEIVHEAVKQKK